jgi:hypothetical protein
MARTRSAHTCRTCGDQGHQARTCLDSYPGIRSQLGVLPDDQVAVAHGIKPSTVATMRRRQGIPWAGAHHASGVSVDLVALQRGLDRLREDVSAPGGGKRLRLTTTDGLLALALDAARRDSNRQADLRKLAQDIDPCGVHVLAMQFVHNDVEWRTWWLVKLKDSPPDQPTRLWLDVSFDALAACSVEVEVRAPGQDAQPWGEA